MSDLINGFIQKKKAESGFISLEDGDSIVVKRLKDIKLVTKVGFSGDEIEVLRLVCEVETSEGTREKTFDNGTQRFAQELQDKEVTVGCGFTLARSGDMAKTRYTISSVIKPPIPTPVPAVTPAPVVPPVPTVK